MPGSTAAPFASESFRGKSANGPYGDSVEELDWSTGEILAALKRLNLDKQTLVIWTSDNGAPRRNPPQGSNAPLKGWGYDTSEGAMRMPCIVRWPGHISAIIHQLNFPDAIGNHVGEFNFHILKALARIGNRPSEAVLAIR